MVLELPVANLYINYSDDNVAVKNLSTIEEDVPIRYKDPCNIETPVLSFDRLKVWQNINDFNYFYLPDMKRYYFVTDLTIEHGYVTVKGVSDVLSSFWEYLKGKKAFIKRQENVYSKYIVDESYPVYATRNQTIQGFTGSPFNSSTICLTVTGGAE